MPSSIAMLLRMLMALLLAAFALPMAGSAACHDAPVATCTMPMPSHDLQHHPLPATACIGCIPPSEWRGSPVVQPISASLVRPVGAEPPVLTGTSPPPDLPPPRA